jgi:predicted transcriptional regulator
MKNVTLAIDEELLEQARSLAERRKTTLNSMVRSLIANEVEQENRIAEARRGLRQLMERSTGTMPPGYVFNRQEIYDERERRLLSRHKRPSVRGNGKKE